MVATSERPAEGTRPQDDKRRGRLTLPEERRDFLRALLLNEYQRDEGFRREYLVHLWYYERLLEALPRVTNPPVGLGADRHPEESWGALCDLIDRRPQLVHLAWYRRHTEALSERWGLRCSWAPPWIHNASLQWANAGMSLQDFMAVKDQLPAAMVEVVLERTAQQLEPLPRRLPWLQSSLRRCVRGETDSVALFDFVPDYFRDCSGIIPQAEASSRFEYLLDQAAVKAPSAEARIDGITYDPARGGDWMTVKRRWEKKARAQWEQNRRQWEEAGFVLEDTRSQVQEHIRWLFFHTCPQEPRGRPLGWKAIADREGVSVETARKPVLELAAELEITLPRLPAGRPPTSRR